MEKYCPEIQTIIAKKHFSSKKIVIFGQKNEKCLHCAENRYIITAYL